MTRIGAWCGAIGVAGNVAGVALLAGVPSAYRPGAIGSWAREIIASPDAASASAVAFTLGLIAIAGWALVIGTRLQTPLARAGAAMVAVGAILDAAGTPAPLIVARYLAASCGPASDCAAAVTVLGLSLAWDALFNLLLGLGLMSIAAAMRAHGGVPRWLVLLTFAAGVASVPVSLQIVSDSAARLLAIAGPLWLVAIAATAVQLWRGRL
jgi:hypothetical protein